MTTSDTGDRVLIDLTIAAPVETVWQALRDPAKAVRWFGWESESLADEVDYILIKEAMVDEAARTIAFEYKGTTDRFELSADGAGSRLRVVRSAPADAEPWADIYQDMVEGWIMFVQQLKFGLEGHDLAPRRTLWLSLPKGEREGQRPLAALGLADLTGGKVGDTVGRTLPTGDTVAGKLWHVSPHQVSMTVDGWDGLLNVHDAGGWTGGGGHGPGMVMITSYGLDDAAFAELEGRWKGWWDTSFPAPEAP
ncbi:MAG: hypothetical protein JWR84_1529 [Caulobacter sp.]|nr:hypothetical protein [Caulobacter sp.]